MVAVPCDSAGAPCLEGNSFRVNSESGGAVIEGFVNGQGTGPLPHGEHMILPNDRPGTTNGLAVKLRGTTYPVCNLQDFNVTQASDVGMMVSEVDDGAPRGGGTTEQDVMVCEVPAPLVGAAPGEGEIDIDTAPNPVLMWAATAILTSLEVIDESIGTRALFEATDGYVDLQMTGTDGAPALADAVQALANRNGRAALRAILDGGRGALNVMRNGMGRLMLVARMKPGLARQLMMGVAAAMTRSQIHSVIAGTRGQLGASAAAQAGSRIPVVGYIIVGVIDVVEWYSNPESRGDWSLLFSILVVDGVALTISAVVASAAAGVALAALGGAAALTVGAALVVASVGIVAGLVAGAIITAIVRHTDLVRRLDAVVTGVHNGLRYVAQGAVQVATTFADSLTEIAEDMQEFGREVEREWNRGWQGVMDNIMSGRGSGLF